MIFKEGDRVILSTHGRGLASVKPLLGSNLACVGTVTGIGTTLLQVKWDNDTTDIYCEEHLQPYGAESRNPNRAFLLKKNRENSSLLSAVHNGKKSD